MIRIGGKVSAFNQVADKKATRRKADGSYNFACLEYLGGPPSNILT